MNLAVVIGVENYVDSKYDNLPACKNDARVINQVLGNVKQFDDILYINDESSGNDAKRSIASFVDKHKNNEVNEFVFYFSGHGERYDNDFFYLFSDFTGQRRETSGLRNSELDQWFKTISPSLCVKIVDACFSGTQYIKSEGTTEDNLKGSAMKYGLNDVYFWCSSRDNEVSFAGEHFSVFTESILNAITNFEGETRYRDLMDSVADEFSNHGRSLPIALIQGTTIDKFGYISKETHSIIHDAFGLEHDGKNSEEADCGGEKSDLISKNAFDLAIERSSELCFEEDDLKEFLDIFVEEVSEWPESIRKVYEVSVNKDVPSFAIPNSKKIGEWIESNSEKGFFAKATYEDVEYEVQEYKALPKKPRSRRLFPDLDSLRTLGLWDEDDTKYNLENVKKTKQVVEGFEYTHSANDRVLHIFLYPKFQIADPVSLYLVSVYSNKDIFVNFSYEFLDRLDWKKFSDPCCKSWKVIKANGELQSSSKEMALKLKSEVEAWIEESLLKKMG